MFLDVFPSGQRGTASQQSKHDSADMLSSFMRSGISVVSTEILSLADNTAEHEAHVPDALHGFP